MTFETLLEQLNLCEDLGQLETLRLQALGKKGLLSEEMKSLGALSVDEKREKGQLLNTWKEKIVSCHQARKDLLEKRELQQRLARETLDVTLPVAAHRSGRIHPLSRTIRDIISIFSTMGFAVKDGPDIEDDFHNFTALNVPPHHPAREEQDTFYFENGHLLRTHTSPVQIRTMLKEKPPLKLIVPGRVYRSDYDATHTPVFHQVEGLVVAPGLHMGHLKGCLESFCQAFFKDSGLKVRFRPGFFPFTEPSAELDISSPRGWLEVLGCGMVHPNVLRNCNIDPDVYQGFAFGMGVERLAMLKYGLTDLRAFYENDQRWLRHYGFTSYELA